MTKKREPEFIMDLGPDVIVVLSDGETWTELSGCSLVVAPRGTFIKENEIETGRPEAIMRELNPKAPYGVVALDILIKRLPLKKLSEFLTLLDHVEPPKAVKGKK